MLYPAKWAALFLPLRERETGGLLLALFKFAAWRRGRPGAQRLGMGPSVVVTLAGWVMILKSVVYLLFPRAPPRVMPSGERMVSTFRIGGAVGILLGPLLFYDWFHHR